jgi:hypothetical protein
MMNINFSFFSRQQAIAGSFGEGEFMGMTKKQASKHTIVRMQSFPQAMQTMPISKQHV